MAAQCSQCGFAYNEPGSTTCSQCDSEIGTANNPTNEISHTPLSGKDVRELPGSHHPQSPGNTQSPPPTKTTTTSYTNNHTNGDHASIPGRITHLDKSDERPPANIYKTLSKTLIGIMFLVPFLGIFVFLAALAITFAILGFPSLSQLFNPFNIARTFFELWEIFVLRSIRGTDTLPIFRGTVEEQNGNLYNFHFIGPFKTGQLVTGHHVVLNGIWKGDTLHVVDGRDTTTNSEIKSSYCNPWKKIFFCTLCLYAAIAIVVFLYGGL